MHVWWISHQEFTLNFQIQNAKTQTSDEREKEEKR